MPAPEHAQPALTVSMQPRLVDHPRHFQEPVTLTKERQLSTASELNREYFQLGDFSVDGISCHIIFGRTVFLGSKWIDELKKITRLCRLYCDALQRQSSGCDFVRFLDAQFQLGFFQAPFAASFERFIGSRGLSIRRSNSESKQ